MKLVAQAGAPSAPAATWKPPAPGTDPIYDAMKRGMRGMKWDNEPTKPVPQGPQYEPEPGWRTELDVGRLAVEWVVLFALIAVCYLTWPSRQAANARREEDYEP
jgi:hypothetical protein